KPPPELIDGEEEWEVEEVLDSQVRRGGTLEFLVKWKGYTNFTTPNTSKKLFGWEDGKFNREYLERLERNWRQWK
ncbi:hypothetical protein AMATHDRAFT_123521, partial [Amanita thiersii Skay4041]